MGGASPLEAIQLQIVVMNMLIGASTVSSIMSTYLCWPAFFTKAYQLETKVFSTDWGLLILLQTPYRICNTWNGKGAVSISEKSTMW